MEVTLTTNERAVIMAALSVYRTNRAAQGKLDEHKAIKRDRAEAQKIAARYASLLAVIDRTVAKLTTS